MKKTVRITAVLLALLLLFTAFPASASAAEGYSINIIVEGRGTVTADPSGSVAEGTQVYLEPEDEDSSRFVSISCVDSDNNTVALEKYVFWYRFNMPPKDVTVTAVFEDRGEINYIWLNDDGSTLDTKIGYEGRRAPVTDKTPVKSNDPNGIYAFDKWVVQSSGDSQVVYTPVFRDTTKGPAFVNVSVEDADNIYPGDDIYITGTLKNIGTGAKLERAPYTAQLLFGDEVIDSFNSITGMYNYSGTVVGTFYLPSTASPGVYTVRLSYSGTDGTAEYTEDITVGEPTRVNIAATSPHQAAVNQEVVFNGTVTFENGTPVEGIVIEICGNSSFSSVWERTTDSQGKFSFSYTSSIERVLPLYFKPANAKYATTPACSVTYVYNGNHSVTVSRGDNGSARANLSSAKCGDTVTLTATPDTGYVFKEWEVVSGGVTVENNSFTMLTSDVVVKPVFEVFRPTVTIDLCGHGDPIVIQTTYGAEFYQALEAENVWDRLDAMEDENYIFRDISTVPLSEFSDHDTYIEDTGDLIDSEITEDMTVYACFFTKIRNVELTLGAVPVGDAAAFDGESYTPAPVLTPGENAHFTVDPGAWLVNDNDGSVSDFEGTFTSGVTYTIDAMLIPDFGYWLDEGTTATANGARVDGLYGRMVVLVELSSWADYSPGDVNGDGSVDIIDATAVQKHLAGHIALNGDCLANADANGDGTVDINDVTEIQKYIAKLVNRLG